MITTNGDNGKPDRKRVPGGDATVINAGIQAQVGQPMTGQVLVLGDFSGEH